MDRCATPTSTRSASIAGYRAIAAEVHVRARGDSSPAPVAPGPRAVEARAAPVPLAPSPRTARRSGARLGAAARASSRPARPATSARRARKRCSASATRSAEWLVIGEAPGAEEDRQGEPFVGPRRPAAECHAAGHRPAARDGVHRQRAQVPAARQPRSEARGSGALPAVPAAQIALLKPKLMLAVGRIAAQNLLATDAPLGAAARQGALASASANTPLIITYHPAYLLRTPADKRKAWEDLKFARATLRASRPGAHRER